MPDQTQPNVLLICVDHWQGRQMGVAGHPCILSPTVDALARNGVRFTNAYSAVPVCIGARRALMTGLTPRSHGDRNFAATMRMPNVPTLAGTFANAGYQSFAVGKLHVYPQRDRIGFGDVILNEEGRHDLGMLADDYELFIAEQGYAGQEYTHAMSNNHYDTRPWHLPEQLHPTNWTAREMCRTIKRRDPSRPGFWYMSFNHPHPPLVPLASYMELYRDAEIPAPYVGDWARDFDSLPYALRVRRDTLVPLRPHEMKLARQAFYAQCTQIDHQIRLVIGMLREEGMLDNTIIALTCDHGDMLGNHGLYAKRIFYEDAANIPFIIMPTAAYKEFGHHQTDDRLVELRDMMPTLLDMCGIPIPDTVEGISLVGDNHRDYVYGEQDDGPMATRMVRDPQFKLVYYAAGNRTQLFDMLNDRDEMHDLAQDPTYADVRARLTRTMLGELYGEDLKWLRDGVRTPFALVGLPEPPHQVRPDRGLMNQRGWRFM